MAKIFLVEDDPLMVNLYERAFKLSGYEVEIAFDGQEALRKLKKMKPSPTLILMDVMMPVMNGLDALKEIKQNPTFENFKRLPVVMLTNLAGQEDAEKALSLGAITYLVKSQYEPKEVVAKIKEIAAGYTRDKNVPEVKVAVKKLSPKK
ncbi:hypothetical protein A3G50_01860 [Candidatus Jorgensenbacteria bacterium RIFCSPLOWO2_12_FULL_42_11]|uniref:Response regulatory domain-containing protein n=1 Tax=Candidatus Jorgensenbacteria bacterium RIFCSPLOWO2_12_FULL_42_11 TaxID=1798473 RepID=A0A1F6C2X4_9BACT|nr:MAG: hypothetical protein A3G50_01860 [Candidatus Jorgensenbacteria bacterium RIFCSPLOWO2_12_FULL_42_11]